MYLAQLEIENFRIFGDKASQKALALDLDSGVNLIVGENDSGKSAIIDAIRLLLGTASNEWFRVSASDFHRSAGEQAKSLRISAVLLGLSREELAGLVPFLTATIVDSVPRYHLRLTLYGSRRESGIPGRGKDVQTTIRAGEGEEEIPFEGYAREFLRVIYLKPLRDAVQELAARQGSRLSQILYAHPELKKHETSDWADHDPDKIPATLLGIAQQADHRIKNSDIVRETQETLNNQYLREFSLGRTELRGSIGMRSAALRQLLERMELYLDHDEPLIPGSSRGLGMNNLLFMATELLLLGAMEEPYLPLVLIEEPEAHLHPQLQLLLIEYLESRAKQNETDPVSRIQVLLTCHSPHLASKVGLEKLTVLRDGQAFKMGPEYTALTPSDYDFLKRFLDVTRTSLFFARGLLVVEGDAEQLLLPTLANLLGRSLTKAGVSVINVGHVGLFRYMRIFQRTTPPLMGIKVACIVDRDIPPLAARSYIPPARKTENELTAVEIAELVQQKKRYDGQGVQTWVSPIWTLEHDLAMGDLAPYVATAVELAKRSKTTGEPVDLSIGVARLQELSGQIAEKLRGGMPTGDIAATIYEDLYNHRASKTETAQYLSQLLELSPPQNPKDCIPQYLIEAIKHATDSP